MDYLNGGADNGKLTGSDGKDIYFFGMDSGTDTFIGVDGGGCQMGCPRAT